MVEVTGSVMKEGGLLVSRLADDTELARAYFTLYDQGILRYWFHQHIPAIGFFIGRMLEPNTLCLRVDWTGPWGKQFIGVGYVDKPQEISHCVKKAEVSEAFVRGVRPGLTLRAAQLMIEYTFRCMDLTVLFGTTPERNKAALRFMKSLGFEYLKEPLPHYTMYNEEECGVIISWMTKARWRSLFKE
jgi:hypothetical protein